MEARDWMWISSKLQTWLTLREADFGVQDMFKNMSGFIRDDYVCGRPAVDLNFYIQVSFFGSQMATTSNQRANSTIGLL